ncbi:MULTISPECIES: IclR family transcriptional regulator [Bhargavaea]|uniref:IclR family transcriptional regulator n=1 Tax=Bhargavaea changchunensis TaxID=2134037 RepID=A0ABW2NCQ2_9BACL|nr:IclR family transcriptional regulator [Bhargavaea sp. CC-171006]
MDVTTPEKKTYLSPAVKSATEIITFLSKYKNKKSTLTEISKGVGINSSTCYRILKTLVDQKVLNYKEETKQFSLGSYLIVLGKRASEFIDYLEIAREYLAEVSKLTNSTTGIVQRIGDEWLYIDKAIPDSPYSIAIKEGQRFKMNAGATAKLFMAYLSSEEREEILDRIGIERYTNSTKFNREEFLSEMPAIKEQGFSISIEEHIEGISGISLPVFSKSGEIEFAITVVMLSNGKTSEELKAIANELKSVTDELSKLI